MAMNDPPLANEAAMRANQFGIVRLVLAALVLFSHSFPLADGFTQVEPLRKLTGTTTFGELAVDFFFVISGYLVSQSLDRSRSVGSYLSKRIRRIYPGYAVAVAFSIVLALACGGVWRNPADLNNLLLSYATLHQPVVSLAFAGNAYQVVNGSLWTIQYEFLCYLLPIVVLPLKHRRQGLIVLLAAVVLVVLSDLNPRAGTTMLARLHNAFRLSGMFLAGMSLNYLPERWLHRPALALVAAIIGAAALFAPGVAGLGVALAGGYAVLSLCKYAGRSRLSAIGRHTDISYGVYLYAWPLQSLVVWLVPGIGPWLVFMLALPMAIAAGLLSWHFIEAPFLRRQRPSG